MLTSACPRAANNTLRGCRWAHSTYAFSCCSSAASLRNFRATELSLLQDIIAYPSRSRGGVVQWGSGADPAVTLQTSRPPTCLGVMRGPATRGCPGAGGRGQALALPGGRRHLCHSFLFQRRLTGKAWKHLRCTCATVHTVRSMNLVPESCCQSVQFNPTRGSASLSCTASPRAVQAQATIAWK